MFITKGFSRAIPPNPAICFIRIDKSCIETIDNNLTPVATPKVLDQVMNVLIGTSNSPGFLFCIGLAPLLKEQNFSDDQIREFILSFRRDLFFRVYTKMNIDFSQIINPKAIDLELTEFELDGYNVNTMFSGGGSKKVDFFSTKKLHFDLIEPLSSNLYGPNLNIAEGYPIFADLKSYCTDHDINMIGILQKIPGTRIITIKDEHYYKVLEDYSIVFELEMEKDLPFSIYLNLINEVGIMHGATDPKKINIQQESFRPISHLAMDNSSKEIADEWFKNVSMENIYSPGDASSKKPLSTKKTAFNLYHLKP